MEFFLSLSIINTIFCFWVAHDKEEEGKNYEKQLKELEGDSRELVEMKAHNCDVACCVAAIIGIFSLCGFFYAILELIAAGKI